MVTKKIKKTNSDVKQENESITQNNEPSFLLKDIGTFTLFATIIIYLIPFEWEILTAYYYEYDNQFISLSLVTMLRNNYLFFFIFTFSCICILFDNTPVKNGIRKNKKMSYIYLIIGLISLIFMPGVILYFIGMIKELRLYIPSVIVALISSILIFVLYKTIFSKEFKQFFKYFLILFLFSPVPVAAFFYIIMNDYKTYHVFEYEQKNYVLLRENENNFIAKKVKIENGKNYLDDDILYLPLSSLNNGLIFKKITIEK